MVKGLRALKVYPWTGHSAIMGKQQRRGQDVGTVLGYFGRRKKGAIVGY